MPDQIYTIIHIGKKLDHLLIVMHKESQGWLFRIVNSQGKIIQEQIGFQSAIAAEEQAKKWFDDQFTTKE